METRDLTLKSCTGTPAADNQTFSPPVYAALCCRTAG